MKIKLNIKLKNLVNTMASRDNTKNCEVDFESSASANSATATRSHEPKLILPYNFTPCKCFCSICYKNFTKLYWNRPAFQRSRKAGRFPGCGRHTLKDFFAVSCDFFTESFIDSRECTDIKPLRGTGDEIEFAGFHRRHGVLLS